MDQLRSSSLRDRVLRASGWSLAGYGVGQAIRFGTNLLMTRLLVPEMFGVMAIATMVIIGLQLFSDFGLKQSVVQSRRGSEPLFLNTVWVTQIVRGLIIAVGALLVGLVLGAIPVGGFPSDSVYASPVLPYVIAALGLTAAIAGFDSTKVHEASRRLALGKLTQIEVISQVFALACMIALAQVDRSIWVLVSGAFAASVSRTVLSHAYLPGYQNRFQWDGSAFREVLSFGKWIFVASTLAFVYNAGDKALLGAFISAGALGVYTIAVLLVNAVEQVLGKLITDVSFPALSEVARDRPADLKRTLYRFHLPAALFASASAGALIASAPAIVDVLYDDRYADAGWMMQILAVVLFTVPSRLSAMCLLSLGRSRQHSNIIAVRLAVLFAAVPLGFFAFGIAGAVWGVVASALAAIPPTFVYAARLGFFDLKRELLPLPAVVAGALAGLLINFVITGRPLPFS